MAGDFPETLPNAWDRIEELKRVIAKYLPAHLNLTCDCVICEVRRVYAGQDG